MLPGLATRTVAALALQVVERDRAYLTKALDDAWRPMPEPSRDERAFSTELSAGTCRWRGILDARLDPLLPRGLASLDDLTRQVLRVAAYELVGPHPTPAHAAVHLAVEAAKRLRNPSLARLVNAVLRSLTRTSQPATRGSRPRSDRKPPATSHQPPAPSLALPPWLLSSLAAAWGEPAALDLARWSLERPQRSLRLNPRRPETPLPSSTNNVERKTNNVLSLPPGAGDLRSHPLVTSGAATPQEAGAILVADALPLRPGAIVLDACAGRGTKTTALAERLPPDAVLLAADVNPEKLARLAPELERLGLPPVEIVAVDWSVGVAGIVGSFDAILVDAPCSGTGTLSRRPEIRWRLEPADVARLAALQQEILRRTSSLLAPGGVLLYAVCSLLPEEGPAQIRALLSASPDLRAVPDAFASPPWRPLDVGAALLPHQSGTDGFYAALLRRKPSPSTPDP